MGNEHQNNGQPGATPRKVFVPVIQHESMNVLGALLAAIISLLAHALLIFLIMNINLGDNNPLQAGEIKSETQIDDEKSEPEFDLTNTDIGIDSSVATNYNV